MYQQIASDAYTQLGFIALFAFSGWVVAYILYRENRKLMAKYAQLMEKVLEQNAEIKSLIENLVTNLNIEKILKEYLGS